MNVLILQTNLKINNLLNPFVNQLRDYGFADAIAMQLPRVYLKKIYLSTKPLEITIMTLR